MGGDNADSIFAPAHNDIEIAHDFIRIQRLKSFLPVKLVGPFLEATKKVFRPIYTSRYGCVYHFARSLGS